MTNDLHRRIAEHREGLLPGFTKRYTCKKLVHFEHFETAISAIEREKQIKAGSRARKIALIANSNPEWKDRYDEITA